MSKSNFIVRGGGDFSALYKSFNTAQTKMSVFKTGMTSLMKGLGITIAAAAVGKYVKDGVSAAMTVESSVNQLNRTMGESANSFKTWAQEQAKAFGMAKEEAFSYGATYSNLISTFASGTEDTTQKTTELLEASAVVASATGRTMEDTMERIRSGLLGNTESIEDLGINVNVAMLESTEAFEEFANGKSWDQLSFQEQQQVRLMAILEQANDKYGDSLAGTTATKQMSFLSVLKDIKLNIGRAFLPIYNEVLPALTALASKVEYVTSKIADFSEAIFGKADETQIATETEAIEDLGDTAEEAGEQASAAVASFDEINQLDLSDDSSSSSDDEVDSTIPDVNTVASSNVFTDAEDDAEGLIDKLQELIDKYDKTKKVFAIPISMPPPSFGAIPVPIYSPEWGLELPTIETPVFGDIPNPIYNPNWNINATLQEEMGLANKTMAIFAAQSALNFGMLATEAAIAMETFKSNVTTSVYETVAAADTNIRSFLETSYSDISNWANTTSTSFVNWGNGVITSVGETASGMSNAFIDGLQTMWQKFKEFATATGESLSESWSSSFSLPSLAVLSTATVIKSMLSLPKASFIPGLANGGITNGPMLAMVGDNPGGKEVVSPLDDLKDMIASAVGTAMMDASQFNSASTSSSEVALYIDSKKIAKAMINPIDSEAKRLGYKTILKTT
jgi:hypothetical protein